MFADLNLMLQMHYMFELFIEDRNKRVNLNEIGCNNTILKLV